jgi:hypothetical protein
MEIPLYGGATKKEKRLCRIRFGTTFNKRKAGDNKRSRKSFEMFKNSRAAGPGGIPTESLKYGGKM